MCCVLLTTTHDFENWCLVSVVRYLNRIAAHPLLCADSDFKEFLEKEGDLPRATSTSALSGAGVMRLFHKVGESFEKIAFKMDENDEVRAKAIFNFFYLSLLWWLGQ